MKFYSSFVLNNTSDEFFLANNVEIWYNLYIGYYDYRGSTVAITDDSGAVTDTFEYDSYGKLINRTGESFVIFGYNGRDGVITDANGLLYMRARYYSPELRRFINADIVPGEISNAITLNRYAYANGNPVSNIDPFGLSAERENEVKWYEKAFKHIENFGLWLDAQWSGNVYSAMGLSIYNKKIINTIKRMIK